MLTKFPLAICIPVEVPTFEIIQRLTRLSLVYDSELTYTPRTELKVFPTSSSSNIQNYYKADDKMTIPLSTGSLMNTFVISRGWGGSF